MIRLRLAAISIATALIGSCLLTGTAGAQGKAEIWKDELPIRAPWLRDNMPEDALAYVRVPHLLGLTAMPKGNALDPALRSKANIENVEKLRNGIAENVLQHLPAFADLRARLLQQHLRSPIEITAFVGAAPAVLIAANLDLQSDDDFAEMIDAFTMVEPNFGLAAPLDDNGNGQLVGTPLPVQLQFDADSGRLLLNIGPAVSRESFVALLDAMSSNDDHPMIDMERRIDESGQGVFMWLDSERAMPALEMFMPADEMTVFKEMGLDSVRSLGLGWGVADTKGRLSIIADVPAEYSREFLPYVSNDVTAKAVGEPGGVFLLSIPTAEEFSRLETLILATAGDESRADWMDGKAALAEWGGVQLEEFLGAIGPEFIGIFDDAGDYLAVRLRDAELWDSIIERISDRSGSAPDSKKISGNTYYHWSIPNEFSMLDEEQASDIGWIATLLRDQRDHFYWTRDDDFLYVASVPQVLIERAARKPRTDVGAWLTENQRLDASEAVFMATATSNKLPRRLYSLYIESLQFLADISNTQIDIWSMPTPSQLKLADEGAIGFTVRFGDPYLGMELMFESNPFEFLFGGGAGGVAAVGIMAAIAIPAYQDYTMRAKVAEGLGLASTFKSQVSEYYMENGRFPDSTAVEAMSIYEYAGNNVWSIVVLPDNGIIVVNYTEDSVPDGGEVYLEPNIDNNGFIHWSCSGTIADKHLPSACRSDGEFYEEEGT